MGIVHEEVIVLVGTASLSTVWVPGTGVRWADF